MPLDPAQRHQIEQDDITAATADRHGGIATKRATVLIRIGHFRLSHIRCGSID